ncbi:hypothetical protein CCB80_03835 [Armatimonadetes bacterium Uphvl-Ar1]|nr:hypothetical protein CCB80_03835 [Armatimonadetes bacterium Uphvl-Ar1]
MVAAQPRWSQDDLWDLFDLSPVSDSDIQKYLDVTLAKCVSWFRASGGSIFLQDGADGFVLRAKFGEQKRLPHDATIEKGQGIAGIVAMSGVARLIDDPSLYPDMAGVEGNQGISSSMVIPLADPRRVVIGVLNISRKMGEPAFREIDLDQAVALAAHVSLAVGNAELVNRLKSSWEQTAVANEQLVAVLDSVGGRFGSLMVGVGWLIRIFQRRSLRVKRESWKLGWRCLGWLNRLWRTAIQFGLKFMIQG